MTTALDIVTDAVQRIGTHAAGETPSDADGQLGLIVLNNLISAWEDEFLPVYQLTTVTLPTSLSKTTYTIGVTAGADIAQTRPPRIESGPGAASAVFSGIASAVQVVSAVEWAAIENGTVATGVPDTLFYDPQYPKGSLNVSPAPPGPGNITFSAWSALRSFAALATSVTLASGAEQALKMNLAVVLLPYFGNGATPDPGLVMQANAAKTALGYTNMASRTMVDRLSLFPIPRPQQNRPASA